MLKKADEDYVEDTQRQIAKLDEDLTALDNASRTVKGMEDDLGSSLWRRSNQLDATEAFWSGPEAMRYRQQSMQAYQSEQRALRSGIASMQVEIKTEAKRLSQHKEMFEEDIEHIQKTRQLESEDSSDG